MVAAGWDKGLLLVVHAQGSLRVAWYGKRGHRRGQGAWHLPLPLGVNGQPWDASPITVARSTRVVAVMSAEDGARAPALLKMAESALDRVAAVRPNGWAGKIFITAVQDSGIFDTYFADSPVAGYYTVKQPDQFQLSGVPPLETAKEGISVAKDKTALRDAVKAALISMINDGTYVTILKKYGVETGAIQASDIK